MTPKEVQAFVDIVCHGFTVTEIETLEDFADLYFEALEDGEEFSLPERLQLEVLEDYDDGGSE